jgi:uncharacterized membrane protein YfcA
MDLGGPLAHGPAWLLLVGVTLLTSALSGALGLGGGTVFVGSLRLVLPTQAAVIFVHAVVQVVSNVSRTWAYRKDVHWPLVWPFLLTCSVTPPLGLWVLSRGVEHPLELAMGLFLLTVPWFPDDARVPLKPRTSMAIAGALVGGAGMLVGATGAVVAPFFRTNDEQGKGLDRRAFIGTKAIAQAFGHLVKIAWFAIAGRQMLVERAAVAHLGLVLVAMCLSTIIGTIVGERLARRLPERWFVLTFRVVMAGLGLSIVAAGQAMHWW